MAKLTAEGKSISQIGAALGITRNAVAGRRKRLGLSDPAKSPIKHRKPVISAPARTSIGGSGPAPRTRINGEAPSVGMHEITNSQCRWPRWNNKERATHRLCGAPVKRPGESYCQHHHDIAHDPARGSLSPKLREELLRHWKPGVSTSWEFAIEHGVTESQVNRVLFKAGLIKINVLKVA